MGYRCVCIGYGGTPMVQQKLWYDGYRKVRGTGIGTVRAASESAVGGAVWGCPAIFSLNFVQFLNASYVPMYHTAPMLIFLLRFL